MSKPISIFRRNSGVVIVAAALALAACGKNQAQQGAPEPVVSVLTVQPATVTVGTELSGRLKPIREAQVRARAAGIVQKRLFEEGSYVRAGQPLFQRPASPGRARRCCPWRRAARSSPSATTSNSAGPTR